MYKVSDFRQELYKPGDLMKILNVTYQTIKNYDISGKLPIKRTETGRRVVTREDLLRYLEERGLLYNDESKIKSDYIYARVSSNEQKTKGDLDRQVCYIVENVSDLQNPVVLKEVGSGLNDKRPKLLELIRQVEKGNVKRVYVTYKDRLTRFGYSYIETVFNCNDVEIIVLQNNEKEKIVEEELVDDMMNLIASFSGKLYGMRSGKNKKEREKTYEK